MSNPKQGRTPVPARTPRAASRATETPPERSRQEPHAHAAVSPVATIEVDASEPAEHLFRRLLSSYLAGGTRFEVVEVPCLTSATREVVREFCQRTLRPRVVSDDGRRIRLADTTPLEGDRLDTRLHDLGERVLSFHRAAVESWSHLPLGADGSWAERDDEIDREAWYLERWLTRSEAGVARPSRSVTSAWTIARSLERIGDHAVTLGELGPRLAEIRPGDRPGRELRQFHEQAMAHLEQVLAATDGQRANELLDVGEALAASGRSLTERLLPAVGDGSMAPATAAAVARALEAVSRTIAYTQDIAQAFFDRSLVLGRGPAKNELIAVAAS